MNGMGGPGGRAAPLWRTANRGVSRDESDRRDLTALNLIDFRVQLEIDDELRAILNSALHRVKDTPALRPGDDPPEGEGEHDHRRRRQRRHCAR